MLKRSHLASIFSGTLLCFSLILLSACSTVPVGAAGNGSSTPGTGSSNNGTPANQASPTAPQTTVPMPQTNTACPAANTARAAVMRPLALGSHQNLIYVYNEVPQHTTIAYGHLRRYDATTGQKINLVTSGVRIDQAQVSADGQWVLFLSIPDARGDRQHSAMLQLVRMDGQGLQTLYCFPTASYSVYGQTNSLPISLQWSVNEQTILVSVDTNKANSQIFAINTTNGTIKQLLNQQDPNYSYKVVTWLDSARFYVLKTPRPTTGTPPAQVLFLIDSTAANPALTQVLTSNSSLTFFSVDSSYDGTQLFAASCLFQSGSALIAEPATGGQARTLLRNDPTDCVSMVRAPTTSALLLLVDVFNSAWNSFSTQVWTINPAGNSSPRTLTTLGSFPGNEAGYSLNPTSQFPWSNVSRDGGSYALVSPVSSSKTQSILVGSLNGGNTTAIATTDSGLSDVSLAGWTTM